LMGVVKEMQELQRRQEEEHRHMTARWEESETTLLDSHKQTTKRLAAAEREVQRLGTTARAVQSREDNSAETLGSLQRHLQRSAVQQAASPGGAPGVSGSGGEGSGSTAVGGVTMLSATTVSSTSSTSYAPPGESQDGAAGSAAGEDGAVASTPSPPLSVGGVRDFVSRGAAVEVRRFSGYVRFFIEDEADAVAAGVLEDAPKGGAQAASEDAEDAEGAAGASGSSPSSLALYVGSSRAGAGGKTPTMAPPAQTIVGASTGTTTVEDIKQGVQRICGVRVERMELRVGGVRLEDDWAGDDFGLEADCRLLLRVTPFPVSLPTSSSGGGGRTGGTPRLATTPAATIHLSDLTPTHKMASAGVGSLQGEGRGGGEDTSVSSLRGRVEVLVEKHIKDVDVANRYTELRRTAMRNTTDVLGGRGRGPKRMVKSLTGKSPAVLRKDLTDAYVWIRGGG
jgi:hypothetical protein